MMKDDENKDAPQDGDGKVEKDLEQPEGDAEQEGFSDTAQHDEGEVSYENEEAQDLKEEYSTENQEESSQLSRFKSMVSSDPKRSMVILLLLVGAIGAIMYYLLYSGSSGVPKAPQGSFAKKREVKNNLKVSAPQISSSNDLIPSTDVAIDPIAAKAQLDQMLADKAKKEAEKKAAEVAVVNTPNEVSTPQPQAVPVPQPNFNNVVDVQSEKPEIKTESTSESKQKASARIKSTMLIGGASGQKSSAQASVRSTSSDYVATASAAPLSKVTKVGNMASLITQGKIIETVLETPVNTNYPGPIRALVSKDVYSEKGSNVLIPKGSRVIGELAGGYQAGQTKVMVKWDRIIMPSGYDIKVEGAPGVGKLGNIGVDGIVDRQLWNSLGNVALLSAINVGMAKIMEKEFGVSSSTTTSTTSSSGDQTTNSTSSPTQQAAKQALDDTSSAIKKWVTDNFTTKPYIEVDQGSVVKIFVNSDIQFPQNISTGVDILK